MVSLESYFKVSLERELERSPKLKTEDIAEIQQWMSSTQPHLPPTPDILIAHFLLVSDCDMEVAKKAVKLNFEYKRTVREFFDDWDPTSETLLFQAKNSLFGFLPKTSPSDSRLFFTGYTENTDIFSYAFQVKWSFMSFHSILLQEGHQDFNVVVDVEKLTFSLALKHPYKLVQKYEAYSSHAALTRVKEIHIINNNYVIQKLIGFFKAFVSKSLFEKLHFYGSPEKYFDSIPPDSVPREYGGNGPSLQVLHDIFISYFLHKSYYEVEVAKRAVQLHFEYEVAFHELFDDWDPLTKDICDQYTHVVRVGFFPRESRAHPRVLLVQHKENSAAKYKNAAYCKYLIMSFACDHFHEGIHEECKVVIDCNHFTFTHLRKSPLLLLNNFQHYINDASMSRGTEIHFINTNSAIKKTAALFSLFMSETTQRKFHFHGEPEAFFKSCSADVVPVEYGGSGPSVQALHDQNTLRVLTYREEVKNCAI